MRIDSHQHFWKYSPLKDEWITENMRVLQRDFLPQDIFPELIKNDIDGCIAVQADQSLNETDFLLNLAEENDFIKGVVGWIDFRAADIAEQLETYSAQKKLKGFRHIVQAEPDDFLMNEEFCRGVSQLSKFGFTYDLLVYPRHLATAIKFVQKFPDQKFVIDHLAKPDYKNSDVQSWRKNMQKIADCDNVFCKASGMVTEADWKNWQTNDFQFALDAVTACFGTERLMFGSDWPVCQLAADYSEVVDIVEGYYKDFSDEEQAQIFGENAVEFYGL